MSKVSQLHHKQNIQEQACLWISRLDRQLSSDEEDQLGQWLKQSPNHHQILIEMASYWDDLTVLNQLSTLFPLQPAASKNSKRFTRIAIAASIVLVSLFSMNQLFNDNIFRNQSYQANNSLLQTQIGEQANFMLPDGSKIHLNTASIVKLDFSAEQRTLTLVQGEASFDVAKDKTRPFTVNVGTQSFTALGTVFNVQKNDDKAMELVVTEGRVLITKTNQSVAQLTHAITNSDDLTMAGTIVASGEKAIIEHNVEAPLEQVPLEQLQRDLAWQQGMLIFEGEPLAQALIEVSRYTNTKFELVDDQLATLKVAGYFKAGDIDGLLASLNSNFDIISDRAVDGTISLTSAN